jgi:lantibiotic modifying enzyme
MITGAARSTLALISRQQRWPSNRRYPGLANGWHGAAWVAFKLAAAGIAVPADVFESIGRRLADDVARDSPNDPIGAMIGCSAQAIIAAYAARHGLVGKAVARRACRHALARPRDGRAWDVQMGLSGALLAFLEIDAVEPGALRDAQPGRMAEQLRNTVDTLCALPAGAWQTGMAHGPAGAIMALESCGAAGWCRITNRRRQRWLDLLSRSAMVSADGGLYWPAIAGDEQLGLQSWCAGTPGIALALLQCFRLTRQPVYLEVARDALAAMKSLARKVFVSRTLCCGSAGYRHIFVEAFRITREVEWLEHAAREARFSSAAQPRSRLGLHQGELGIAYLADRLASPGSYPFPALGVSSA